MVITIICPRCHGEKVVICGPTRDNVAPVRTCPVCEGKGVVPEEPGRGTHFDPEMRKGA